MKDINIKPMWKEYISQNGRHYYYNRITKKSSWKKPDEYIPVVVYDIPAVESSWREFKSPTGHPYYYNSVIRISTWKKPSCLCITEDHQKQSFHQKTGEELFMDMLEQINPSSTSTWEETLRLIINNSQYHSLDTLQERKKTFQKYIEKKALKEKQDLETKKLHLKQLLEELFNSKTLFSHTGYELASNLFQDYLNIECKSLYDSIASARQQQEREQQFAFRREKMQAFTAFLNEHKEIQYNTKWENVIDLFESSNSSKYDYEELLDYLTIFEDHISSLRNENEKKISKYRAEFKKYLLKLSQQGIITLESKWKHVYLIICNESSYLNLLNTCLESKSGTTPLDIFKCTIEDLKDRYEKERYSVRDWFLGQPITTNIGLNEFIEIADKSGLLAAKSTLIAFYNHDFERYRQQQLVYDLQFKELLKRLRRERKIRPDSNWNDQIEPFLRDTKEYRAIGKDRSRILFDKFLEKVKIKDAKHYHNLNSEREEGEIDPVSDDDER